jgi:hypothetical protein
MQMEGELVPAIRDEWERHSFEGRRMDCIQYATSEFVIKTATTPQEEHIVNLDAKRCSCNFFHDMQRACAHARSLRNSEEREGHKGVFFSYLLCRIPKKFVWWQL